MIIVRELSPVMQRIIKDAVIANPHCSPDDFLDEITYAVSDPDSVEAIYREWETVAVLPDEDEEDIFAVNDIFEEMRLIMEKLDSQFERL